MPSLLLHPVKHAHSPEEYVQRPLLLHGRFSVVPRGGVRRQRMGAEKYKMKKSERNVKKNRMKFERRRG